MIRSRLLLPAAIIGIFSITLPVNAQGIGKITFIGEQSFAANSQTFGGTVIGGLSGLDYDDATGLYYSNSDSQGATGQGAPRFYTLTADITATAFNGVSFQSATTFKDASGGLTFVSGNNDFENTRLSADRTSLYITSEGNANAGLGTSVYEFDIATGNQIRNIAAPGVFTPSANSGIRQNLAFEAMAFKTGGASFLAGTEGPLRQESPAPGNPTNPAIFNTAQPVRLAEFDTVSGNPLAQYAYAIDPLALPYNSVDHAFAVQGLVDILNVGDDNYLGMERSFTLGRNGVGVYDIKIYQFTLAGATDISGINDLDGASYTTINKRLLLDLASLPITLDNVEGMTLGPDLGNGQRALLLVSDDNFTAGQKTQFLAFGVTAAPEPGSVSLVGTGLLAIIGFLVRRKRN